MIIIKIIIIIIKMMRTFLFQLTAEPGAISLTAAALLAGYSLTFALVSFSDDVYENLDFDNYENDDHNHDDDDDKR